MSGEEQKGKMLTVSQVAARAAVADATVRQWINTGKLKAYELPGSGAQSIFRIEPADLERFLKTFTKQVTQGVYTRHHIA